MRVFLLFCLTVLLAACQSTQAPPPPAGPQFSGPPLMIDAGSINVTPESDMEGQRVLHAADIATDLTQGVKLWTADRVRLNGSSPNRLEFAITDASVKETALAKQDGISGAFTNDQATRYEGKLGVTAKLYTGSGNFPAAEVAMQAAKTASVAENASLFDRQKVLQEMVNNLVQQMDQRFAVLIPQYFANYMDHSAGIGAN